GLVGQRLGGGLGDAEVDHLYDRRAVVQRYQDITRFDVPVNYALLVGVLHGPADVQEQFQPVVDRQVVLVAEVRDRNAADQLHDEIRSAAVGRAGIQDAGDVGVVHQRQGLPFHLETGHDLPGGHARLEDLESHFAADGLGLFR